MGLDMYLEARFYLSKYDPETNTTREELRKKFNIKDTGNLEYVKVNFEVAYWRKATQIHAWFVENVQEDNDNCGEYYVSREQLKELLETVKKVLEDKTDETAMDLLPPAEGFLVGGTNLDGYYWSDLQETKDALTTILNDKNLEKAEFYYNASW